MCSMLNPGSCIFVVVEMSLFSLDSEIPVFESQEGSLIKKFEAHQSNIVMNLCSNGTQRNHCFCHNLGLLNFLE